MKLLGLTLATNKFEDYLSFLTEVLELELAHLDEESMILELQENLLEIRKAPVAPRHENVFIRFVLEREEYESLINKITFFSYRKGQLSFQVATLDGKSCRLIDPDGRAWCFSHGRPAISSNTEAIL